MARTVSPFAFPFEIGETVYIRRGIDKRYTGFKRGKPYEVLDRGMNNFPPGFMNSLTWISVDEPDSPLRFCGDQMFQREP